MKVLILKLLLMLAVSQYNFKHFFNEKQSVKSITFQFDITNKKLFTPIFNILYYTGEGLMAQSFGHTLGS